MNIKKPLLAIVTTILSCVWITSCKDKDEPINLEVNPTSVTIAQPINSAALLNITCNGEWSITSKPDWIDTSTTWGNGNSSITLKTLSENDSYSSRSGNLEIKCNSKSITVQITQEGKELETLEINPSSISLVSNENASASVSISCNSTWSITSKPDWINVSSISGKGNTTITITALTANDTASPRSGNMEVTSGSEKVTLLISQVASLETGCEINIADEVILNTSATFRLTFGSQASYYYAAYFPTSSAGWSDDKIVKEMEDMATPSNVEDYVDITADELLESTSYIQCVVAYNEKGKRGEVMRKNFTTPSSKNAPMAYISDAGYSSTKWYWTTTIGATAHEYYMLVYGGDIAFIYALLLAPSDIGMIFKDTLDDRTSYVNSQEWNVSRSEDEKDLLVCTWAQRDKKWSSVLNMFYGSITDESPFKGIKKITKQNLKKSSSQGKCISHTPAQRETLKKYFKLLKK